MRVFVRWLLAVLVILVAVIAGFTGAVAAASVSDVPSVFLGVGWVVLAVGVALAAVVAVGRHLRAVITAVAAATVVAAWLVVLPLPPAASAPEPVAGMQIADLPTGSRLAYARVEGAGDRTDPPIVVLHGGPGVADMAGDLAFFGRLTGTGRDVILYDQIGAGHSSRLADPSDYTLARDLEDLEALLDVLGVDRAVLVGHSYGGTLAAAYAGKHPAAVEALVFLAPGQIRPYATSWGTGMVDRLGPAQRASLYLELLQPRALLAWLVSQVSPAAARAFIGDDEMDRRFDSSYARSAPGLYCRPPADVPAPRGLGAFTNAMVRRIPDLRPGLAEVEAPALIVKPQCDYLPWSFGTDLATALPDARLVYLEGAGHSLYAERPDEVEGLIDAFLAGRPLPIPPQADLEAPGSLVGPIGPIDPS